MTTVALIPARGGSKGIPLKNLQRVGGRSLVRRSIEACAASGEVDRIIVTTDHPDIAAESRACGAEVIERPESISGDTASSESALIHALEVARVSDGTMVFTQCTSPFTTGEDISSGVQLIRFGDAQSVFAATLTWDFLWRFGDAGAVGVNHDAAHRPRRQDLPTTFRETGAFYAMDIAGFLAAGHRFFGRVEPVEVNRLTAIDIDEPEDLVLARALATSLGEHDHITDFSGVQAVVMDFDGVHTDDRAHIHQDGTETVQVSRADGMGVRLLRLAGIPMMIISSEENPVVTRRAEKLQVSVVQGTYDKLTGLDAWLSEIGVQRERTLYIGNDINDLDCLNAVGYPVAVANSNPRAIEAACYVTTKPGGAGAVREIADQVLSARPT